VSAAAGPSDELTAAERRVVEHLGALREEPPRPGRALAPRVVRTARWQRGVRAPLRAVAVLASAVADALGRLLRPSARRAHR
jgi:hypothetical protein